MLRFSACLAASLCLLSSASAQTPPTATTPAPTATPAKPAVKKSAPKAKPAAKPTAAVESGPCRLGVISAIGDRYSVQKIGFMVFQNQENEVPIDWGLDELVFARVRAATGADPTVRMISYPKGAFEPFYHPKSLFIRDPGERLPEIVRSITPKANCERYLVATTYKAELPGTHVVLNGIGTYYQGLPHLFANISITLIDGRTYEQIKRPFANFGASLAAGLKAGLGVWAEDDATKLDNALFPDPPAAASGSAVLRERTRALITDRLDKGLPAFLKED